MRLSVRLRRLRENPLIRGLVAEHRLSVKDLVQPLFVKEGLHRPADLGAMPGQKQWTEGTIVDAAKKVQAAGVPAVILFGIPAHKDLSGAAARAKNGLMPRVLERLKKKCTGLLVLADVCLCEYLRHGHCGHLERGRVSNDASVRTIAKVALTYARAGADVIAPSDMMDGRVGAIRRVLDRAGFTRTPILSYAVKYASAFYGPFREAAESAPAFGDRRGYQMNPPNVREAFREVEADLAEGADFVLVKPALAYLDVIRGVRRRFEAPIGAYSVSGEYAMIKAAAANGWLDEKRAVLETHLAFKRAGASFILTYWAETLARWLKRGAGDL